MEVELKPWDVTEFLRNEQDLSLYLDAVLEEDDGPTMYASTVEVAARARGGVSNLSNESGVLEQDLLAAMNAEEEHALQIVERLAQAYAARSAGRLVA